LNGLAGVLAGIVIVFGGLAAVLASWVYIDEYISNLREQKERAQSKYPAPLPFSTGWVFVGYHNSFNWVEGPMAAIVYRSAEARNYLQRKDFTNPYDFQFEGPSPMLDPLTEKKYHRRELLRSGNYIREQEELIRYRACISDEGDCAIPATGDVLRVSKMRRLIIAEFRSKGLANQLLSPPQISDPLTPGDETGVELDVGALIIVRDVKLGAYSNRPASVWCRIAACEKGIPQCDQALGDARKVKK
jgi:hypothetical protein